MKNKRTYSVIKLEKKNRCIKKYALVDDLGKEKFGAYETIEEAQKECDKYNSTYYLSDYSNDEILDYFNSIDFKPLLDKINELIGLELTYDIRIEKNRFGTYNYFEIENRENLVDNFPILALAWRKFKVSTFNANICCNKETGKLSLWCDINYSYRHYSYGTNGATILTAWYEEGKWIIRTEKETYNNQD